MSSISRPLILSTILDESFTESDKNDLSTLLDIFDSSQENLRLVYMSHDNSENLIQLAAKAELPVPEMFLADTGTTALKGDGTGTIEPLQRSIIQLWPGKDAVHKALSELPGVKTLEDDAPCRQSIKIDNEEAVEALKLKIDEIGCQIERIGDHDAAILPYGVDMGSSLGRWFVQENISPSQAISFGVSAADVSLFGRGWRGGIYAGAPESLLKEAGEYHNVHVSKSTGATAVLETLRHFGWLEMTGVA